MRILPMMIKVRPLQRFPRNVTTYISNQNCGKQHTFHYSIPQCLRKQQSEQKTQIQFHKPLQHSVKTQHLLQDVMIGRLLSNTALLARRENLSRYISQCGVSSLASLKLETALSTRPSLSSRLMLHKTTCVPCHIPHRSQCDSVTPRNWRTVQSFSSAGLNFSVSQTFQRSTLNVW